MPTTYKFFKSIDFNREKFYFINLVYGKDGKKMKSNQINKFFKRLLTTVLTLSLATIPMITPLTVYADDSEYIGGIGGAAGGGNKTYSDGVSQNKTGLLCYN